MSNPMNNTGNNNNGSNNAGSNNTGDRNAGSNNTGYFNTGNWNACNRESGFFNTAQSKTIRVFNKDCDIEVWDDHEKPKFLYFDLTQWIPTSRMSDQEKEDFDTHETTDGYLKQYEYKEAFQKSYNNASDEDKALLLTLPNFDADVFFEISGVDVRKPDNSKEIAALETQVREMMEIIKELKK